MNGAFDVDCPRTPDGGDGDDKQKGSSSNKSSRSSRSRPPSNRPPRSRSSSATAHRNRSSSTSRRPHLTPSSSHARKKLSTFSPHVTGMSRKSAAVPLEPEEYIAEQPPSSLPPRAPSSGSGPAALQKAPSSGPSAYRAAPNSGNGVGIDNSNMVMANRNRTHSTEAFGGGGPVVSSGASTNPFDHTEAAGGNRSRSSSGNWWKEEIVDEGAGKGAALDEYYGLNPHEKQDLYGPSAGAPTGPTTVTDGPFDIEQQQQPPQMINGSNPGTEHNNALNTNIYQNAASMNNAGCYSSSGANTNTYQAPHNGAAARAVDDYSFSNVNLTPGGNVLPPGVASPGNLPPGMSNPNSNDNSSGNKGFQLPKWFGALATSNNKNHQGGYLPPNMDHQTNIAPRGSGSETWSAKPPGVTFDCFNPSGFNKKQGFWGSLSPQKKVGLSVIWVVLVCTIFGVTISELKKANQVPDGTGYGAEVQGMNPVLMVAEPSFNPTPWPETDAPTSGPITPTTNPTMVPSRSPVTDSPIAGYFALHTKEANGTPRPTRNPTTDKPTASPTPSPTSAPTAAPTESPTVQVQKVQAAASFNTAGDCSDEPGMYINHNDNPKDCYWLGLKPGFSDRKNKNCGGRPVQDEFGGTTIYPTTQLGHKCRRTCGLYNGCGTDGVATNVDNIMKPFTTGGGSSQSSPVCKDGTGYFLNHLENPKTCEWLFNDKPGQSDRKNKNCGYAHYAITELGRNCMATCAEYGNNGCAAPGIIVPFSAGSGGITKRDSDLSSSSACQDSDEVYENHLGNPKDCEWLFNDKEGPTDRKDSNCGPDEDDMSDLGKACVKTCSIYTGACGVKVVEKESSSSSDSRASRGGDFLRPTPAKSSSKNTKKTKSLFLNYKKSLKDCDWLYNDKAGKTDRKDRECGSEEYPIVTELGENCPEVCSPYKEEEDDSKKVLGELTLANGSLMQSYSSPNYSYSLTSSSNSLASAVTSAVSKASEGSTSCINGEGTYLDHKHALKSCDWLMGVGHPNQQAVAKHRQEKNCGGEEHGITELGLECPWSCKVYNDCGGGSRL